MDDKYKGMTVNERLWVSDLLDKFDVLAFDCVVTNKTEFYRCKLATTPARARKL